MTDRELMQQALDALQSSVPTHDGFLSHCKAMNHLRIRLAQPEQEHAEGLAKLGWQYFECPACGSEGARAFPKPEQPNDFRPDWDAMAVMVEEQQRMAKRIEELEAMLERQTARIVDLQTHIENLTGEE